MDPLIQTIEFSPPAASGEGLAQRPDHSIPVDALPFEATFDDVEAKNLAGQFAGYKILSTSGQGGLSVVYRARQLGIDRLVALKVIGIRTATHSTAARFLREIRLLGQLDHPHIVPVYDSGQTKTYAYYSMKLLEGGDLRKQAARYRAPERAASVLLKIADALHFAHSRGVIHGDLKPGNILFDARDEPYLCDFGAAHFMADDDDEIGLNVVGTPLYMAPERIAGESSVATDVYGLGVILYELMTGEVPYKADTLVQTIGLIQRAKLQRPRGQFADWPQILETICVQCLERDPERRPSSAKLVADQLRQFLSESRGGDRLHVTEDGPTDSSLAASLLDGIGAMAEGVLLLGGDGRVAFSNPSAAEILGRELVGLSLPEWLSQQRWLSADAATEVPYQSLPPVEVLRGQPMREMEVYLTSAGRKRGTWIVFSARAIRSERETQESRGAIVLLRDVNIRKAQRTSAELYRSLLSSLGMTVFRKDYDGRYTFVNDLFCAMLGKEPHEILGRTDFDLFSSDLATPTRQRELDVLQSGEGSEHVEEHTPSRCEPGCRCRFFAQANATPGSEEDQICLQILLAPAKNIHGVISGLQGVVWNITARRRAERQLERTARALEAANSELARSNAELGQFAYVASHDLQEPLRMVASYTQLLQRRYEGKLDARADEFIGFAVDGATRMQRLINDLLDYSRVGSQGQPLRDVAAEEAFEKAKQNLREAIKESGASVTHDPLPRVKGDVNQLVQVFQNLMGNAIKFRGTESPRIHVSARRDLAKSVWTFSVRDQGIGIESKHLERIFTIFQRLHTQQEYPGSGMGLAICRKIVERHGGSIWAESDRGKGTCFFFTLNSASKDP